MSLYNMLFGVNPSTYFLLPLIGIPPDDLPRYRDCFLSDDNDKQIAPIDATQPIPKYLQGFDDEGWE